MFELGLSQLGNGPKQFLFIGAHCDDIEIGCGGTILRLIREYPLASFHWIVLSSNEERATEARAASKLFLEGTANNFVSVKDFRNGYFPYIGASIKDYFENLKGAINPDLIFTHYGQDYHQDHRVVSDLTWNTFRNHLIFEYEIPKYDGGLGSPNLFFPLLESDCQKKIDHLLSSFASERSKAWFTKETFAGLMRLRGIECNAQSGYAEAFYCKKAKL